MQYHCNHQLYWFCINNLQCIPPSVMTRPHSIVWSFPKIGIRRWVKWHHCKCLFRTITLKSKLEIKLSFHKFCFISKPNLQQLSIWDLYYAFIGEPVTYLCITWGSQMFQCLQLFLPQWVGNLPIWQAKLGSSCHLMLFKPVIACICALRGHEITQCICFCLKEVAQIHA